MNTIQPLSPRESQILDGRRRGLACKQIGAELQISTHTVRNALARVLIKLGAHSSSEAVFRAMPKHCQQCRWRPQ